MTRASLRLPVLCFALVLACDDGGGEASPPDAPTDVSVEAVTGGAHLTWVDASDDEDEFAIERKGPSGAFEEIDTVPFDTAQYHDATATTGMWVYRIGARNDAGESWSSEVSVTIP
jgi:hypothetical protein